MSLPTIKNRHQAMRSSLRTALFRETLLLLSITVIVVTVAAFILSSHEMRSHVQSQLQSIAIEKSNLLESTIARQREQISLIGHQTSSGALEELSEIVGFKKLLRISPNETLESIATKNVNIDPKILQKISQSNSTVFRPIMSDNGWTQYIIASPFVKDGIHKETLIAIFDATTLASRVLQAEYVGRSTEILLLAGKENEETALRFDHVSGKAVPLHDDHNQLSAKALVGNEGVISTTDYAGIAVYEAYKSVPSLGWAVMVKIDQYEVTAPIVKLAVELAMIGLTIVLFLSLSIFVLAKRITSPLEELTKKLHGLGARHWQFTKTISTGDEIEVVDGAAEDLTKRLRASYEHLESIVRERTEALRKEHAEDQAVLQSMEDGLIVTDDKGIVTYMNPPASMLAGEENFLGKKATDILTLMTKDNTTVATQDHPVNIVLATKKRYSPYPDPQFTLPRPNKKETPLQIRATPILRGKKLYGSVLIIRDITEERRIDHMKSEFISLVSHQLRTPLSSMRWYLEMLIGDDAGPLTDDQADYVKQVSAANTRMLHLVSALLNVSRIELGHFELSSTTISLANLIKNVLTQFDLELRQKKIGVKWNIPDDSIGARSDKGLLVLILENLISNAIKYSEEETAINIGVCTSTDNKKAIFTIQDSGIGIPLPEQKDIGRKLFRASNARINDTDGNGLGLYISHIAAESIGAELNFVSEKEKGTTFTLTIPLNPQAPI